MKNVVNGYREMVRSESSGYPQNDCTGQPLDFCSEYKGEGLWFITIIRIIYSFSPNNIIFCHLLRTQLKCFIQLYVLDIVLCFLLNSFLFFPYDLNLSLLLFYYIGNNIPLSSQYSFHMELLSLAIQSRTAIVPNSGWSSQSMFLAQLPKDMQLDDYWSKKEL